MREQGNENMQNHPRGQSMGEDNARQDHTISIPPASGNCLAHLRAQGTKGQLYASPLGLGSHERSAGHGARLGELKVTPALSYNPWLLGTAGDAGTSRWMPAVTNPGTSGWNREPGCQMQRELLSPNLMCTNLRPGRHSGERHRQEQRVWVAVAKGSLASRV